MKVSKLRWYVRRLASMSLPEIQYRVRQQVRLRQDRRYYQHLLPQTALASTNSWPSFFFSAGDRPRIQQLGEQRFPLELQATLNTAERLLAHKITLFGTEFDLGPEIHWHQDPKTGRSWPDTFYADIDIRDGKTVGGVKWVWELNRHHHLVTLAKAYFLTDDERYAREVCAQLQSWLAANRPGYGVNWTSSLELALRIINWAWTLNFIRPSDALTSSLLREILTSVAEQARYIARHLSAFSSANNHRIGEAAGLVFAGLAFPDQTEADIWWKQGLSILTRELEWQIHADGVPAEQATEYLAFVLDFNLQVWRLADLNGLDVPSIWLDRLGVAAEFLGHMMDDGGYVPPIGDGDDAWVVRLDDRPEVNNFQSILVSAAIWLDRPELNVMSSYHDEKSFWLLGEAVFRLEDNAPEPAVRPSRVFQTGGYTIMRAPDRHIVFDHAPLGYLSTAAHGHADALGLWLSVAGQALLVDPNTYAYQEGYHWRDFFRSTAAHNTLRIDGLDQSEMQGTFLWGRKARARQLVWRSTETFDLAVAEHDGYLPLGVRHRRHVFFVKPDFLLVRDEVLGEGVHQLEQFWHFPSGASLDIGTGQATLHLSNQQMLSVFWTASQLEAQQFEGQQAPIQGWISPHYGHIAAAPVLCLSTTRTLPCWFETGFYFGPSLPADQLNVALAQVRQVWQTHSS